MAETDQPQEPTLDPTDLDRIGDRVTEVHRQILICLRGSLPKAIEAGGLLCEAKRKLGHGGFLKWVEGRFEFGERTAQRYMRVSRWAEENPSSVTELADETFVGLLDRISRRPKSDGEGLERRKEWRDTIRSGERLVRDFVVEFETVQKLICPGFTDDSQSRRIAEIGQILRDNHSDLSALAEARMVDESAVKKATELQKAAADSIAQITAMVDQARTAVAPATDGYQAAEVPAGDRHQPSVTTAPVSQFGSHVKVATLTEDEWSGFETAFPAMTRSKPVLKALIQAAKQVADNCTSTEPQLREAKALIYEAYKRSQITF